MMLSFTDGTFRSFQLANSRKVSPDCNLSELVLRFRGTNRNGGQKNVGVRRAVQRQAATIGLWDTRVQLKLAANCANVSN